MSAEDVAVWQIGGDTYAVRTVIDTTTLQLSVEIHPLSVSQGRLLDVDDRILLPSFN